VRWPARALLAVIVACSLLGAPAAGARPSHPGPAGTVWVTNQTLNTVAAYDAGSGELLRTVDVGAKPIGVVAPPRSASVYVSNESDDTVSVIDEATGDTSTIAVGDGPHHMVHSRGGRTVYAVNSEADTFTALDAATGRPRFIDVPVGDQPSEVLVTPSGRTAWISIRGEDKVGVFRLGGATPRKLAEVAVGDQPDTLQLTPNGRTLVVALRGTFPSPVGTAARVDLVDTRSLRVTPVFIEGATTTGHQWLSPDGRLTYVAIESAAGAPLLPGVAVIDNRRAAVAATWAYPGDGRPHGVYFEPTTRHH
jgi:YVTN family beta-propeller protein